MWSTRKVQILICKIDHLHTHKMLLISYRSLKREQKLTKFCRNFTSMYGCRTAVAEIHGYCHTATATHLLAALLPGTYWHASQWHNHVFKEISVQTAVV
jgi:hypothetical protein